MSKQASTPQLAMSSNPGPHAASRTIGRVHTRVACARASAPCDLAMAARMRWPSLPSKSISNSEDTKRREAAHTWP
eukprot:734297-Pleurochrysis_carterae.AAC.1